MADIKDERRKSDALFKVVLLLLSLVQALALAWVSKIDAKAERVPVLEERISNIQVSVSKIEAGVETLLSRRR